MIESVFTILTSITIIIGCRYYTPDPSLACLFVLALDTLDRDPLSQDFVRNMPARYSINDDGIPITIRLWSNLSLFQVGKAANLAAGSKPPGFQSLQWHLARLCWGPQFWHWQSHLGKGWYNFLIQLSLSQLWHWQRLLLIIRSCATFTFSPPSWQIWYYFLMPLSLSYSIAFTLSQLSQRLTFPCLHLCHFRLLTALLCIFGSLIDFKL